MRYLFLLICCLTSVSGFTALPKVVNSIAKAKQIIVVKTENWDQKQGELNLFERDNNGNWKNVHRGVNVVVGQKGMAWGIGRHPQMRGPVKKEGDLKSPAGVFTLGTAFGHTDRRHIKELRWPYISITCSTLAINDPKSLYYNKIIDSTMVASPDWTQSEIMSLNPFYLRGLVIDHNEGRLPKRGSCSFLQVWQFVDFGTSGSTAMNANEITYIINWLKPDHHPLIIQLPIHIYDQIKTSWELPN
ncbi:MAG: hypothetical protein P0S95_06070 [Rhabdochlamydiaceae bacterium]|nr:hypothetical protein [Candidatus Amphrikana amoebophyrae]